MFLTQCQGCGAILERQKRRGVVVCGKCSKARFYGSREGYHERPYTYGLTVNAGQRVSSDWAKELPRPVIATQLMVAFPFDRVYSKNVANKVGYGRLYTNGDVREARSSLAERIATASCEAGVQWASRKTYVDILVEKKYAWGDAINVVDTLCDAIKVGIGVDDRWFAIGRLDWSIAKVDPLIYLGIGQEAGGDQIICRACGGMFDLVRFSKKAAEGRSTARQHNSICCCCRAARSKNPLGHLHPENATPAAYEQAVRALADEDGRRIDAAATLLVTDLTRRVADGKDMPTRLEAVAVLTTAGLKRKDARRLLGERDGSTWALVAQDKRTTRVRLSRVEATDVA